MHNIIKFWLFVFSLMLVIYVPVTNAEVIVYDPEINIVPPYSNSFFLDVENHNITYVWSIENVGLGNITITLDPVCPPTTSCKLNLFTNGIIPEGGSKLVSLEVMHLCSIMDYSPIVGVKAVYTDIYGLNSEKTKYGNVSYLVTVPNPSVKTNTNKVILESKPYDLNIYDVKWFVQNNGTGDIRIFDSKFSCDDILGGCNTNNVEFNILEEIETAEVGTKITTDCDMSYDSDISFSIQYDDNYNMSCILPKTYNDDLNFNEWFNKKPDGCVGCITNDDCTNTCIEGYCVDIIPPTVELLDLDGNSMDVMAVPVGTKLNLLLKITNNLAMKDYVGVHIYASEPVSYWLYFLNHKNDAFRNDVVLEIPEKNEQYIPVVVEANKAGSYSFDLELESKYSTVKPRITIDFNVLYIDESGVVTGAPGLANIFLIMLLFVAFLSLDLRKKEIN